MLIMKFGGAALASAEGFGHVAELIDRRLAHYPRLAVVVSAMGNMTDQLIRLALRVNAQPPEREMDMLISVGERISISLLAMALAARGRQAVSFTGSQSGIITSADHTEARILGVKPGRLLPPLEEGKVVIVAGFQGMSEGREITTLGRGGSDTTAVALGVALGAHHVEFYKDVKGIFEVDPNLFPQAAHLPQMDYSEALQVICRASHPVLHPRAVHLAARNGLPLQILSFKEPDGVGTWIGQAGERALSTPLYEPL